MAACCFIIMIMITSIVLLMTILARAFNITTKHFVFSRIKMIIYGSAQTEASIFLIHIINILRSLKTKRTRSNLYPKEKLMFASKQRMAIYLWAPGVVVW